MSFIGRWTPPEFTGSGPALRRGRLQAASLPPGDPGRYTTRGGQARLRIPGRSPAWTPPRGGNLPSRFRTPVIEERDYVSARD